MPSPDTRTAVPDAWTLTIVHPSGMVTDMVALAARAGRSTTTTCWTCVGCGVGVCVGVGAGVWVRVGVGPCGRVLDGLGVATAEVPATPCFVRGGGPAGVGPGGVGRALVAATPLDCVPGEWPPLADGAGDADDWTAATLPAAAGGLCDEGADVRRSTAMRATAITAHPTPTPASALPMSTTGRPGHARRAR
jgi:hypothetical protein